MAAYTLHITANPKHFDPAHADIVQMIRKLEDVRNIIRGWHDSDVQRLKP